MMMNKSFFLNLCLPHQGHSNLANRLGLFRQEVVALDVPGRKIMVMGRRSWMFGKSAVFFKEKHSQGAIFP